MIFFTVSSGKEFDVFLNIPWLGIGRLHDDIEEFLAIHLGLGHRERSADFEVSSDTVLFFDREPDCHQ